MYIFILKSMNLWMDILPPTKEIFIQQQNKSMKKEQNQFQEFRSVRDKQQQQKTKRKQVRGGYGKFNIKK